MSCQKEAWVCIILLLSFQKEFTSGLVMRSKAKITLWRDRFTFIRKVITGTLLFKFEMIAQFKIGPNSMRYIRLLFVYGGELDLEQ